MGIRLLPPLCMVEFDLEYGSLFAIGRPMIYHLKIWKISACVSSFNHCRFGLVILCFVSFSVTGCGPSQEDLMMRSARRARTPDPDEGKPAAAPTPIRQAETPVPSPNDGLEEDFLIEAMEGSETGKDRGEKVVDVKEEPAERNQFVSILDRRPAEPLSDEERRRRAAANIEAVGEALANCVAESRRFPATHTVDVGSGFSTLSWRVHLLPYLGYDKLYQKFDFKKQWNRSPNKDLLKYIPDEFVSPERFDTKTNILAPVGEDVAWTAERRYVSAFEDGLGNTIMLVEASDAAAVQWTQPGDLDWTSLEDFRTRLGSLRGDGAYAVWGDGTPTLLVSGLTPKQFEGAFSPQQGDGLRAADIHRPISLTNVTPESIVAMAPKTEIATTEKKVVEKVRDQTTKQVQRIRHLVPTFDKLGPAKLTLSAIYGDRMKGAGSLDQKRRLVDDMLANSSELQNDPVGKYAIQSAAMNLAIQCGHTNAFVQGLDFRVRDFDVDAFEENLGWLLRFGNECEVSQSSVDGAAYVKRCIKVIYAACKADDYSRAADLARLAYKYADKSADSKASQQINRVRSALLTANRKFREVQSSMEALRENPSDKGAAKELGLFLCFYKGDWDSGLPLLAQGSTPPLQTVAEMELRDETPESDFVRIGDAWWDLSRQATTGFFREACMGRAVHWYKHSFDMLGNSLDRLHVDAKLKEFSESDQRNPFVLIDSLAQMYGTDLTSSLAAAIVDQSDRANNND